MPDYISREGIKQSLESLLVGYKDYGAIVAMKYAIKSVNEAPAADVTPVVRCKDCEHKIKREYNANTVFCGRAGNKVRLLDDFCSSGARMDGGDPK